MTTKMASSDGRYGVSLSGTLRADLFRYCERAGGVEVGGVLVGRYTTACDCAVVTRVVGPPTDSKAGPAWFVRGVAGLSRLLADCWHHRHEYYLGEWHYHPGGPARPSPRDRQQMSDIAADANYCCRQPILLLVGGSVSDALVLGAFVYSAIEPVVELIARPPVVFGGDGP